ncbi:MAG: chemotaxis protein CheA [Candidatus Methylomirabilota bacterium]|nr:chemotaxis protein CheA [candidate division NC10 bacterium]PWB43506.1 MAG: chemotaxis protein CheA [candidate division NC10 bacterium]
MRPDGSSSRLILNSFGRSSPRFSRCRRARPGRRRRDVEDDDLLQGFFEESAELLADFEECLLQLETNPNDQELLNKSFRAIHTIKGNSGMLGFERIGAVAHSVEDLLGRLRKHEMPLTRPAADLLLRSADVIKRLFAAARGGQGDETDGDELKQALHEFLERGVDGPAVSRSVAESGPTSDIRPHEEVPKIGELLLEAQAITPIQLDEALRKQKKVGEILIEDRATSPPHVARALEQQVELQHKQDSSTIRVSTEKVDKLINLVGELVITQSIINQNVAALGPARAGLLEGVVGQMDRNLRELQERVMAVRMLPIGTVFRRFPRVVRDLAKECGKTIVLQIHGEETELDKTVIERISDPMTHLIRNAVDHGIEPPDRRLALGKPAEGRIQLDAYHQGGSIFIEVADDGRGLDRSRILRKATEQGLISGDESLTDDQVYRLIFQPGFSTAERVTDVSGRGVGMDVVIRNIEGLGGSIVIATEAGRGTRFTIKLPLTLAIMDGLSIQVGDEVYIIPLLSITESIRPKPADLGTVVGRGEVVNVRGQALPIVRLYERLDVTPKIYDPAQGLLVIVEQEGRRIALLVDELLGQQQVVIKSLETNYRKVPGVSGATILGDGRVAMILDIPGLIRLASGSHVLRLAA